MFRFPPKEINTIYGYRTRRSMKNQYTWDFAQKYSAVEMMKLGLALLIMTCLGFITNFDNSINLSLGLGLLFLTAIILFYRVEKAIKKNFKDKG